MPFDRPAKKKKLARKGQDFSTIQEKTESSIEVVREASVAAHSIDLVDNLKLIRKQLSSRTNVRLTQKEKEKLCKTLQEEHERTTGEKETPNASPIPIRSPTNFHFLSADELDYDGLAFDKFPAKTSTPIAVRERSKQNVCPEIVPKEAVCPEMLLKEDVCPEMLPKEDVCMHVVPKYDACLEMLQEVCPETVQEEICPEMVHEEEVCPETAPEVLLPLDIPQTIVTQAQAVELHRSFFEDSGRNRFRDRLKRIPKSPPAKVLVRKKKLKDVLSKTATAIPQCPLEKLYYS